ncbi:MAG: 3-carboxy-cis,cis-muconate cycloisomerase [Alphaproteobacteria bacterium]|nr:3-carboxy-cis,cis-muconate cycloisomerase [Alphaproteobacteria bacterium]
MATVPPGFDVFRDLFSTPEMRRAFSEQAWFDRMVEVEGALARAEASVGVVPEEAARVISKACGAFELDAAGLKAGTERVGYPVLPLVRQIAAAAGDAGGYVHWGATTQDIMDTALVLQVRAGLDLIEADLRRLMRALIGAALTYRNTPMTGRTHLQHALPVTFGFKCANWLAPMTRALERLREGRARVERLQFVGAVGTLASLGDNGQAVREALGAELGLGVPAIGWHTARDNLAETASGLGILTGALGKIATDVILLMQSEIAEVFEPYAPGRGGSSTMPQKRNPVACEYIIAAQRNVQAQVPVMLAAGAADHERGTGPWHAEWTALPQIFLLTAGALARTAEIAEGMEVDADRMAANLMLSRGLIMAEPVMMALAKSLGRQQAHDVVEELCRAAIEQDKSLAEVLKASAAITAHLGDDQIDELLDPANYTGLAGAFTDAAVAEAEEKLGET